MVNRSIATLIREAYPAQVPELLGAPQWVTSDPYDIIGAVKTAQELAQMGAEHWENSVVLSDFAYTVKPGFIATPVGDDGSPVMLDGTRWGQLVGAMEALGVP